MPSARRRNQKIRLVDGALAADSVAHELADAAFVGEGLATLSVPLVDELDADSRVRNDSLRSRFLRISYSNSMFREDLVVWA